MSSDETKILHQYMRELMRLKQIVLEMNVTLDRKQFDKLPALLGRKENAFVALKAMDSDLKYGSPFESKNSLTRAVRNLIDEILAIESRNRNLILAHREQLRQEIALTKKQKRNYKTYLSSSTSGEEGDLNITF